MSDQHRALGRELSFVRAGALRHQSRRDEALQALDAALAYTRSDRALDIAEVRTAKGEVLRDAHRFDLALLQFDVAEKFVGDRFREPAGFVRWLELQLARVEVYYWLGNLDQISPLLERVEPYVDDLADTEQRIRFYGSARTAMLRRARSTRRTSCCASTRSHTRSPWLARTHIRSPGRGWWTDSRCCAIKTWPQPRVCCSRASKTARPSEQHPPVATSPT